MTKKHLNSSVSKQIFEEKYSSFINILLFVFPIVINSIKGAGDLILFVLAMLGLFVSMSQKVSPLKIQELKILSWLTFSHFSVSVLSVLFSGKIIELSGFITRDLHFLFAPFIGLAIYKAEVNFTKLLLGVKVGIIVLGAIVFTQYIRDGQLSGVMNRSVFGSISVIMVFFAISNFAEEQTRNRVFTSIVCLIGITVIVLNASRSSWVVFLILSALYMWLVCHKHSSKIGKNEIVILTIFTIFVTGMANITIVQDRMDIAAKEFISWTNGSSEETSVGLRLEMWKSSLPALKKLPLTGYGLRNTNPIVAQYANDNTKETIGRFNHLHNEYLSHLVAKGVLGLIAVLTLLFIPLWLFISNLMNRASFASNAMGVFMCTAYAISGFANTNFGDVFMNAFYVLFLSVFLPNVMSDKWQSKYSQTSNSRQKWGQSET